LPPWLREELELPESETPIERKRDHIRLLDTRRWFAALLPKNKPLEV